MKLAQNDEMNPNTQSVHPPHVHNYPNMEPFPSGHLSDKCPEPGKHSRMDSPFPGDVQPYVRSPLAPRICHAALCDAVIALLFIVLPHRNFCLVDSSTDVVPETDAALETDDR
jgi:hypothetical protein